MPRGFEFIVRRVWSRIQKLVQQLQSILVERRLISDAVLFGLHITSFALATNPSVDCRNANR